MGFDYAGMLANVVAPMMAQFGMQATLRRTGVGDRSCMACVTKYNPMDMATRLDNPTARIVLIDPSYGGVPAMPPDWQYDQLVTYVQPGGTEVNEILPFKQPLELIAPAGIVLLYIGTVHL